MALTQQQEPSRRGVVAALGSVWAWIVRPDPSIGDVGARRQAQLMMGMALVISLTNIVGIVASLAVSAATTSILILGGLVAVCLFAYGLGRTRYYWIGSILLTVGFAASGYALVLAGSAEPSISLYSTVLVALVMGSALLPLSSQVALILGNMVATAMLPFAIGNMTMAGAGRDSGIFFSVGILLIVITAFRNILERARLAELQMVNQELNEVRVTLEERVVDRTADLERRARYLEAAAIVAHSAASVLEPGPLLDQVVKLIGERLGFYHAGIFLLDPGRQWAVLKAASSPGGQIMLDRGHRLAVGEGSIVGYVTTHGESRIALDVGEDPVFFDNPDLPDTRSEIALPLRARGVIIGALDVQSTQSAAFSDEDAVVLQTLADQVAVAIDNANLFEQVQERLEAERRVYGEASRETWRRMLRARPDLGFFSQKQDTTPAGELWRPEMRTALRTGAIAPGVGDKATLAIPIKIRGQVIGVIDGRKPDGTGEWTAAEIDLLETMVDQLGVALDSARLYEDTQRRAARERLLGEVTARVRETLSMDTVLQTAVREIGEALGVAEVELRLAEPARDARPPADEHGDSEGGAA